MSKFSLTLILIISLPSLLKAQHTSSISIETGLFYTYGNITNPIINFGDYFDPIMLAVGYEWGDSSLLYKIRLGYMNDNMTTREEPNLDPSSVFYTPGGWSPREHAALLLELQTTIKWLNHKNKLLPLINLGLSTEMLLEKSFGSYSFGDGQTNVQIFEDLSVNRRINPFLLLGFEYKLMSGKRFAIPLRSGFRIPFLNAYAQTRWKIQDQVNHRTTYEIGKRSGFASYFTIGLDIKL